MKRLNEIYNEWKSDKGFFHFLFYYFSHASPPIECPFLESAQDALLLDMKYHGGHSGQKIVSTFIDTFLSDIDGMQDTYFVRFSEIFWKLNGENLLREYSIYSAEYNPLHNYDMTETLTEQHNGNHADTIQTLSDVMHTGADTVSISRNESNETETSTVHNINGFDSVGGGVQSDSTTDNAATTTMANPETNYTETEYDNRQQTTGNTNNSGTTAETITHTLSRAGNIGVTTSTQMLEQHGEFWKRWNFYESILFPAVDKLLTIPIY